MVSTETVAAAMGAGKYALALEETCIRFGIVTALEKAHFLAQVAHESDGLATAREYASGRAYEGRKDLRTCRGGGGGIRYKARGLIQVTGRANYAEYSRWKYGDDRLLRAPERIEELPDAVDAAAWYWTVARPKIPTAELLSTLRRMVSDALAVMQEPDPTKQRVAFVFLAIQQSTEVAVRVVRGKEITRMTVIDQLLYHWALHEIHALAGAA